MLEGYQLCTTTEGKSPNTIAIVTNSVSYFQDFLTSDRRNKNVTQISQLEIRAFILYLQQKRCFSNHRFNHAQDRGLSGHTINCYLRSLRIFFSWLVSEDIIGSNPFDRVKIPRSPRKVIPTFSDFQIQHMLNAIDTRTTEGYRHHTIILALLDTSMRVSELCHLKLDDVWLEDGMLKILGKGNKERLIPIGKQVQRLLWHYISRYRPQALMPNGDLLFLTREGRPLTKDRVEKIMTYYGKKAGLKGVRCSPYTLRHTAAVRFLRNGGDVFSLQRILGHSQLDVLRGYMNLAQSDISKSHQRNSPTDNLEFKLTNSYSPMLFTADGYQVVVMPMLTDKANEQTKKDREAKAEQKPSEQKVEVKPKAQIAIAPRVADIWARAKAGKPKPTVVQPTEQAEPVAEKPKGKRSRKRDKVAAA